MSRRFTIVLCALVTVVAIGITVVVRRTDRPTAAVANQQASPATGSAAATDADPQPSTGTVRTANTTSTAPAFVTIAAPAATPTTITAASPAASGRSASALPPDESAAPDAAAVVAAAPDGPDGPDDDCPGTEHGAIVDRVVQRGWLCDRGMATSEFPITSAKSMPDPGTYPVYAKDLHASSNFGGHFSTMTHFVAFTYGERTQARIAFHSVPALSNGSLVQPLESVGELGRRGDSSGCIRLLPADAERIWAWLSIGDAVHVVS